MTVMQKKNDNPIAHLTEADAILSGPVSADRRADGPDA